MPGQVDGVLLLVGLTHKQNRDILTQISLNYPTLFNMSNHLFSVMKF